ncbi:MAG: hypothetical protein ACSHWU_01460 [Marinicella sp.]
MKKIIPVIFILLITAAGLSIARPTPRDPGLDRPAHNCLHNDHVYTTIPVRAGGVCPAPPIYLDQNGKHLPIPTDQTNKHTPEDCIISITTFVGPNEQ